MTFCKRLTVKQVAAEYGFCEETVRRAIRSGKLKAYMVGDRSGYRLDPEEVERWISRFIASRASSTTCTSGC